jgi:glutamine synthetase type III
MLGKAQIQYNQLRKLKNSQSGIGSEKPNEVKIEKWSNIHEAQLQDCLKNLKNPEAVHAVCEVRERKRNATLGLLPTMSELSEIISAAEPNTPLQSASDNAAEIQSIELETTLRL